MLDINMLKETRADFEDAVKTHTEFERVGIFNQDENENTYDGCENTNE